MNPYDKSLNLTETTTNIKTNRRETHHIVDLVDDAFAKGLATRFDSFADMMEALERHDWETQGLVDYLRDEEILVNQTAGVAFVTAMLKPGTKIGGKRVQDYSIAVVRDEHQDLRVFVIFTVATKAEYTEALREVAEFAASITMTEEDMEWVRQHMKVCPDMCQCATSMTQMGINASIEMMALAAGGRS